MNTQNITDGLNNIQTQTNQVANSLTNLADKFKRPIKPVLNTDGLIDADKTIEKVQKKFSELGTVSVRGIYGDKLGDDQLEKMIVNIESAQGEVRTLTFQIGELSNAQKKLGEGDLFHLTKGTSDNSGIEKLIISTQKAQDKIKALRTSLTADLEAIRTAWNDTNSNKSVRSTANVEKLETQYAKVEQAIINLSQSDDTTFASMKANVDVQIQKLNQMVAQYHNAEKAEKSLQNQVKNYGDKIDSNVLKLNNARPATKEEDLKLVNILDSLVISAGLQEKPQLYVIEDAQPNAFATGRNPKHAVICVTTGLLEKLEYYELEGVLAHEMSHIKNYDILLSAVVSVMVGFVVILSDWFTRISFYGGRRGRDRDNDNNGNAIVMLIGLIFLILAPIFGQLMQLAISRKREFLADATAIEFTRNPDGLISALEKISADPNELKVANKATENMYIANPFRNKKKSSDLWSTHPSTEARIEALRNLK